MGEQLALAMHGQSGAPPGLYSLMRATHQGSEGVCPSGARDGYKEGQDGAPYTSGAWGKVNWNGMRPTTAPQKMHVERLLGAERIDQVVRNRDFPEEEGLDQEGHEARRAGGERHPKE